MKKFQKDFSGWAELSQRIENRKRPAWVEPGMVCWANLGVNIGSEEDGKNANFSRPVLIIKKFNEQLCFSIALTSRRHTGPYAVPIEIKGTTRYAILDQARTLDLKRIEEFISGIGAEQLKHIKQKLRRFLT